MCHTNRRKGKAADSCGSPIQKRLCCSAVENYFEGDIQFENNQPATTKANKEYHGYGIKSIKYTVKKYNGWVTIDTKDNWFKLNVVIPLPREV